MRRPSTTGTSSGSSPRSEDIVDTPIAELLVISPFTDSLLSAVYCSDQRLSSDVSTGISSSAEYEPLPMYL